MIEVIARIHDRFSVEFKIGFVVKHRPDPNNFSFNMWLFVPNSLDINPQTYSKNLFYRDVKSNFRLITPIFRLCDIAGGQALPLANLTRSFLALANNPDRQAVAEYEYEIKMFMAILKSSVRDEIKSIISLDNSKIRSACGRYIECLKEITTSYRQLREVVNVPAVPWEIRNYYVFGDEFLGNTIEKHTYRLITTLSGMNFEGKQECVGSLKEYLRGEIEYLRGQGYPVPDKDSPDKNREVVFRHGILKKYIESDLFLNAKKKRDGVAMEQVYLSLAAGLSMIFATAVAFSFQQKYGNFTMPLFVALVISYMLKDRIKETMRYWFAHRLKDKYFDNKTIVSVKDKRLGWIKEGVDFITDDKTPKEVMTLRSRTPLLKAENRVHDEKIILYRKMVRLDSETLSDEKDYTIEGINDILRLHLMNLTQKMDNPDIPLFILDEDGEPEALNGQKVYYVNIIIQMQHDEQLEYRRYRLVFNRRGILELEQMG